MWPGNPKQWVGFHVREAWNMILGPYKNALFIAWELVEISKSHFWNFENFTWKNHFFRWKFTFPIFLEIKFVKIIFLQNGSAVVFHVRVAWNMNLGHYKNALFLAPARLWKFQKSIFWNFEISLFFKNRDAKMSLEISKKIQNFRDVFL